MNSFHVAFRLRSYEWLLVTYFAYLTAVGLSLQRPLCVLMGVANVALVVLVGWIDNIRRQLWSGAVRDWFAPVSIIIAYWSLGPFVRTSYDRHFQFRWVDWDRQILDVWGLRAAIESAGPLIPGTIEIVYLLLYALPPLLIGLLYFDRRRNRVEPLMFMILSGTLLTYSLIAMLPSEPPRLAFPGVDMPTYVSAVRRLNLWLQNSSDIDTGVFPSGHVTVAFSCAFAVLRVLPERPWLTRSLFLYAFILSNATIYGRYHYAADAAAGFAVSLLAYCAIHVARRAGGRSSAFHKLHETKSLATRL